MFLLSEFLKILLKRGLALRYLISALISHNEHHLALLGLLGFLGYILFILGLHGLWQNAYEECLEFKFKREYLNIGHFFA